MQGFRIVIARRPTADVAISGRHLQFVQGNDKTYQPIASVAALTAQPLAALPPYGCGVPLAGSERLAGWQVIGQHHRKCKGFELSLRGGQRPTWQSREGSCVFAVAFLLSNRVLRDSHVASLLGMTRQGGPAVGTVHCIEFAVLLPLRGRERHAAPLQWRVRSAILPGNLQLPMALTERRYRRNWCMPFSRRPVRIVRTAPGGACPAPTEVHTVLSAACSGRQ